jgi:magnesium-transporting ATPase (P-type)
MNMATSATLSFGLALKPPSATPEPPPQNWPARHGRLRRLARRLCRTMIAVAAFILEAWLAPRGHSPEFIRTVLLQMLVTAQWVYMINCRSSDSFSLNSGLLRNKGIWLVSGVLLLMQLVIIYVPVMQTMFGTEGLPLRYWFITLVIGIAMFLVVEVEKRLTRRFRKAA